MHKHKKWVNKALQGFWVSLRLCQQCKWCAVLQLRVRFFHMILSLAMVFNDKTRCFVLFNNFMWFDVIWCDAMWCDMMYLILYTIKCCIYVYNRLRCFDRYDATWCDVNKFMWSDVTMWCDAMWFRMMWYNII